MIWLAGIAAAYLLPLLAGWPWWPGLMLLSAALALAGWRAGGGLWRGPAILLAAYLAMRGAVLTDGDVRPLAAGLIWIVAGFGLLAARQPAAAAAFGAAGLAYPAAYMLGGGFERLAPTLIVSETCAIVGFLALSAPYWGHGARLALSGRRGGPVAAGRGAGDVARGAADPAGVASAAADRLGRRVAAPEGVSRAADSG